MSVSNPAFKVTRWSVVGMEGMWVKMFDPPSASPATPDLIAATNPVPEIMAAAGFQNPPKLVHTVQRDLLHNLVLPTWDGQKNLVFYAFADADNPSAAAGTWPGATIRMPRGAIFHCETSGKGPPPHTIHWHGIEPTPMNDGVGHCSMELGHYVYKWQPNFIGTYFYHCHRNTMQHFEFGLYGMLLIEPPDAYFATQADPAIPIGHCRDSKRRTAAHLVDFPQFPDWNSNLLTDPDPWTGNPALKFATDPHAMTVAYDVEALWVLDDRDSVWSDLAPGAKATFPAHGLIPGVNDNFTQAPGAGGFFAFNDFNADYWFVTGVPVPAHKGGSAAIPPGIVVPPALNSGVSGMQVSINAQTGQTILIRCLDAAYNSAEVTFPVNVVIIAWDGRALGVPPYGHNEAYLVPAGTPIVMSTARRFDALIRATTPINDFATVKFINTRGQVPGAAEEVLVTARIPFNIGGAPQTSTFVAAGKVVDQFGLPLAGVSLKGVSLSLAGSTPQTAVTDAAGRFSLAGLANGSYEITPTLSGVAFSPVSSVVTVNDQNVNGVSFAGTNPLSLTPNKVSPQDVSTAGGVTFTAAILGGPFEYQFLLLTPTTQNVVQDFSTSATWNWATASAQSGSYTIQVKVRPAGGSNVVAQTAVSFVLVSQAYVISEALDALRMSLGERAPTAADLARYDLAPLINGVTRADGRIDIQDVIVILRKVVGLPL